MRYEDDAPDYRQEPRTIAYFDYLKDLQINDPKVLYNFDIGYRIAEFSNMKMRLDTARTYTYSTTSDEVMPDLIKLDILKGDDLELALKIQQRFANQKKPESERESGLPVVSFEEEDAFYKKYKKEFRFLHAEKFMQENNRILETILGTDKGIVFDLIRLQKYASKLADYTPLDIELPYIAQMDNPFYLAYFTEKNKALLAKIEENKNKKGYNVYETPQVEEDNLFHELMKPFQGKVVLVDFWATWCGPCRSAMKQFESTKESFKDKDVVFVYLTDESSPLGTWQNMIADIDGEHYRLTTPQFQYLRKKFGARGVPSYMILDRKGEQRYFKVGFEGAQAIAGRINEML